MIEVRQNKMLIIPNHEFFDDLEYYSIKKTEDGFKIIKHIGVIVPKTAKKKHRSGTLYNWVEIPVGFYKDFEIEDNIIYYTT